MNSIAFKPEWAIMTYVEINLLLRAQRLDLAGLIALTDGPLIEALAGRGDHPDAPVLHRYAANEGGAQDAVIGLADALFHTAMEAAHERGGGWPETWEDVYDENADQIGDELAYCSDEYEDLSDEGRELLELHARRVIRELAQRAEDEREEETKRQNEEDADALDAFDLAIGVADVGDERLTGEGVLTLNGTRVAKIGIYRLIEGHIYRRTDTVTLPLRAGQNWMPLVELRRRVAEELGAEAQY